MYNYTYRFQNVFVKLNGSFTKQYDNGVLNEKELEQLTGCFNREMRKEWELENTIENFNESQKKFYDNIEPLKLGDIEINDWSELSTEHKAVLDYRVDELKKIREKKNQREKKFLLFSSEFLI